ncbi:MAG: formyltransferase family protein [Halobacteriaceae archaeon]
MRLAGLASNRGRNLLNVHDRRPGGAELDVVVTNDADAPVLDAAAERGVATAAVERREGEARRDHERRVLDALADHDVDLVCLDGYMRVLSEVFLDAAPTTLNVHPSLLPAFPGTDGVGDALAAGVRTTGCTVHVVTNAVTAAGDVARDAIDGGPIVTQEAVPVYADDDRDSLGDRVLHEGEFRAYPRAVRWFAEGAVDVSGTVAAPPDEVDATVSVDPDVDGADPHPGRRPIADDRVEELRYGENPHQSAALYADPTCEEASVAHAAQVSGEKGMSYVNYLDAEGGLDLVKEFAEPAAVLVKHANPAGCATADDLTAAYDRALATDPKSAFGGVVALNRACDVATAERIVDSVKHGVVAPGYEDGALDVLGERENMRVLDVSGPRGERAVGPDARSVGEVDQPVTGGRLVQDRDRQRVGPDDLEVVTAREPTDEQVAGMCFAWQVVKHVTSNGIVFADGTETVGLGVGQVSRVDAVELAARKAARDAEGKSAEGAVMASDAFFPFPDGVEAAAEAGVEAVVQPGGSIRDDEVIDRADDLGIAMAFTGQRAFRHD